MEVKNLTIEDLCWLAEESVDFKIRREAFKEMLTRKECPIKYVWEIFIDKKTPKDIKKQAGVWFQKDNTTKFLFLQYLDKVIKNKKEYSELVKISSGNFL